MSHVGTASVGLLCLALGGAGLAYPRLLQPERAKPSEEFLFLQSVAAAAPSSIWPRSGAVAFYSEWAQLASLAPPKGDDRIAASAPNKAEDRRELRQRRMRNARRVPREVEPPEMEREGWVRFRCLDERCRMKRVVRIPYGERSSERSAYDSEHRGRQGFFLFQD
jgi:hypothetical protein